MTYEEALAEAYQRILDGTRAYNMAHNRGPYDNAKIWFATLQTRRKNTWADFYATPTL